MLMHQLISAFDPALTVGLALGLGAVILTAWLAGQAEAADDGALRDTKGRRLALQPVRV